MADRDPDSLAGPTDSRAQSLALWLWVVDLVLLIVGPWLLLWWFRRRTSPFVEFHGKACCNHTATVLTLMLVVIVVLGSLGWVALEWLDWPWISMGISVVLLALLFGLGAFTFVVHVVAAFKAAAGVWYTPPLCWKFVK
jgi:uncharacterized Tic20 family protein